MSDWNVSVDNELLDVRDVDTRQVLEEIRDLLQLILERLPEQNIPVLPAPTEIDTPEA